MSREAPPLSGIISGRPTCLATVVSSLELFLITSL